MKIQKVRLFDKEIKQIYFDSFPQNERMSFPLMIAMSKLWNTQFLSFYDGNLPCGLIYLAVNRKLVFIMFLAVDKGLRSKGYGSAILQEMQRKYPHKKIIVSIEPCAEEFPDIEIRQKRKDFYLRNGFKETFYRMRLNGVEQEILITNGVFSKREFQCFFALYSNFTMYPKIWSI